jgi:hypothetical protein
VDDDPFVPLLPVGTIRATYLTVGSAKFVNASSITTRTNATRCVLPSGPFFTIEITFAGSKSRTSASLKNEPLVTRSALSPLPPSS